MEINLTRPLLFFDIESTGLNIASDSIIELSFVKVLPGGEQRIKTWRLKPWDYARSCQKPITPGAQKVHGISDEELKDEPRFMDVVDEVLSWLEDSDLAGFNSAKFDLPMLAEEIERVRANTGRQFDINLHDKKMVDVQTIYHKLEPRNLRAAYRFYCGGADFENAHAAEADTLATYEVLKGQLGMYGEDQIKNDVDWLAAFTEVQKNVDYAGRLAYDENGEAIITFGKHKGKTAREVYKTEPSYFAWISNGDFTLDTKAQFEKLRQKFDGERKAALRKPLNEQQAASAAAMLASKFGNRGGQGSLF